MEGQATLLLSQDRNGMSEKDFTLRDVVRELPVNLFRDPMNFISVNFYRRCFKWTREMWAVHSDTLSGSTETVACPSPGCKVLS